MLGADETGIRVNGKLVWVHAARTDALTRYTVSPKRGYEGMKDAGVLTALAPATVLVSDYAEENAKPKDGVAAGCFRGWWDFSSA